MVRPIVLAAATAILAVSGAGGAATQQTPKHGGTLVIGTRTQSEPACLNVFVCNLTLGVNVLLPEFLCARTYVIAAGALLALVLVAPQIARGWLSAVILIGLIVAGIEVVRNIVLRGSPPSR